MGKGNSKSGGGSANGISVLKLANETIDLSESPLRYSGEDKAVKGNVRNTIDTWENKRVKNKIEYGTCVDANGNVIEERRGGHGSVKVSTRALNQADTYSHVHPRNTGMIGGSFSEKDMENFKTYNVNTYRATAKEGTYSISKSKGFDGNGLYRNYSIACNNNRARAKLEVNYLKKDYLRGGISDKDFIAKGNAINNKMLVANHNWLMANQSKYGYTYTLERRKP